VRRLIVRAALPFTRCAHYNIGSDMSAWVVVAREGEIAPGKFRVLDLDGTPVAVFNIDGTYYAIEDACTHDGGDLTSGWLQGDEIICPRHGARFCVRTGAALTAPAFEPTATFPVRVNDGNIEVRDSRWD
jgi:3-phenylpropionate/trans-cinnamate dioxygenase ferredoxin subunit